MPRTPRVTSDEVLRSLARDGWTIKRQSGSHTLLRHPSKPGRPNVPRHAGRIIAYKTLESILSEAGLSVEQFRELL